ncbi:hypothetical protein FACS1894166_12170 [Bacilli bacterium]|nr:hypothetical protein FACS1894166_12170 [Bacilli bacterium]
MAGGDITLPNSTIAEYGMYGVYLNSLTATLSNVGAHALEGINLYNDRCSLTINNGATIGDNGLKFTPGMNGDN